LTTALTWEVHNEQLTAMRNTVKGNLNLEQHNFYTNPQTVSPSYMSILIGCTTDPWPKAKNFHYESSDYNSNV